MPPGVPRAAQLLLHKVDPILYDLQRVLRCPLGHGCLTSALETVLVQACGGQSHHESPGILVVENVGGACAEMLRRTGKGAFTVGHTIFSLGVLDPDTLRHERVHVAEYDFMGDGFVASYFGPASFEAARACALTGDLLAGGQQALDCLSDKNFFELGNFR